MNDHFRIYSCKIIVLVYTPYYIIFLYGPPGCSDVRQPVSAQWPRSRHGARSKPLPHNPLIPDRADTNSPPTPAPSSPVERPRATADGINPTRGKSHKHWPLPHGRPPRLMTMLEQTPAPWHAPRARYHDICPPSPGRSDEPRRLQRSDARP